MWGFGLWGDFSYLFFYSNRNDAWVVEVWDQEGERGCCDPRFLRQPYDWDLDAFFR